MSLTVAPLKLMLLVWLSLYKKFLFFVLQCHYDVSKCEFLIFLGMHWIFGIRIDHLFINFGKFTTIASSNIASPLLLGHQLAVW